MQTNLCSPLATNAISGHIWDEFSSASYKSLPSVGEVTVTDPITGKPTISSDALTTFSAPPLLQLESSIAIVQEAEICPAFLGAVPGLTVCPARAVPWGNITVPALVVDGYLDKLVGVNLSQALFDSLGSANKQLIVFPRNSHGWFLEDNHDATVRVFDRFLSQF